jgi:hypothetical protein
LDPEGVSANTAVDCPRLNIHAANPAHTSPHAIHRPPARGSSPPPPAIHRPPGFVPFPRYCDREEEEEKRQWSSVAVSDDDDRERRRYRHRHRRLRSDDDDRLPIQPAPKVSRMRGEFLCARLPKLTLPKTSLVFFYSNGQSSYGYYKSPLFFPKVATATTATPLVLLPAERVICSCASGHQGLRCGP